MSPKNLNQWGSKNQHVHIFNFHAVGLNSWRAAWFFVIIIKFILDPFLKSKYKKFLKSKKWIKKADFQK